MYHFSFWDLFLRRVLTAVGWCKNTKSEKQLFRGQFAWRGVLVLNTVVDLSGHCFDTQTDACRIEDQRIYIISSVSKSSIYHREKFQGWCKNTKSEKPHFRGQFAWRGVIARARIVDVTGNCFWEMNITCIGMQCCHCLRRTSLTEREHSRDTVLELTRAIAIKLVWCITHKTTWKTILLGLLVEECWGVTWQSKYNVFASLNHGWWW